MQRPTPPAFDWADAFTTIGVTGTNGKTSTTRLIASVLQAGYGHALAVTTIDARLDGAVIEVPNTEGGFYQSFRRALTAGATVAAVECTSQALAGGYARKWRFDHGVFTNLTADHLDSHGSWEHYLASKAQLFAHLGPGAVAAVNASDASSLLIDRVMAPDVRRVWYSAPSRGPQQRAAHLAARTVSASLGGTVVDIEPTSFATALGLRQLNVAMVGDVYAENALAAAAVCLAVGVDPRAVVLGLASCPPVRGRFEVVARDPAIVIDFAHTPDGLARTCDAARKLSAGRLIVVFGAGGDRSVLKRAAMGEAVGYRADVAFVTTDNPRNEDPKTIAAGLMAGLRNHPVEIHDEPDRAKAIEAAIGIAGPHDLVLIAGKGHETGQRVRNTVIPFSDHDVVASAIGG